MILILFSTLFLACTDEENITDCPSLTDSKKKDLCIHNQIVVMPPEQITELITLAKGMNDSMIRGAAIAEWIKLHNNDINQNQGQELCKLLDGRDRSYCLRRLSSPHLKR
jgi:hypothetical protein|tara:strand:+ start:7 stop:336 length:330 start_codon:yes stop_codon:yes gene_type:complete